MVEVRLVLSLGLALALLFLVPTGLADDAVRPAAKVEVSGPSEVILAPEETTPFQLHVSSRLECGRGMEPPLDLVVNVSDLDDEAPYRVDPTSVQVPWTPDPAESNVYVVDEVVSFNATSHLVPDAPTAEEALLVVTEVEETQPKLHCRVDGYDLEHETHAVSFMLVPQDMGSFEATEEPGPPVQWLPLLLAVSILAALALFATIRERRRRGE